MGLGIIAGPVSGVTLADGTRAGLEFLDFDYTAIYDAFVARLTAQGALSLLQRLPCEPTPGGGRHYGYLCVEWGASTVLAQHHVGSARKKGGLCVVAPSLSGIPPSYPERGYTMVRETWMQIPLITPEAR